MTWKLPSQQEQADWAGSATPRQRTTGVIHAVLEGLLPVFCPSQFFKKLTPVKNTHREITNMYILHLISKSSSKVFLFSGAKTVQQCVIVVPACVQKEIRCNKDGKWTAEFSMCSGIQGSCPPPPALNSVEYSCDQGTDVGEWILIVESHRCWWLFCWDCFVFWCYYYYYLITTIIGDIVYFVNIFFLFKQGR